ncbi:MAG: hypothetical protein IJ091_11280 [Oscillospiraceae bacterium]|nr:hypothetical protein [Oscillospiraceae bacterium]MBQ8996381.1 hypothetical protein [Oscillospiraceae bacterium]
MTQRQLTQALGYNHTKDVRDLIHSMRCKGWGVLSNTKGMSRTSSRNLKDQQAAALLARAHEIITAAEGLVRKDQEEMTLEELMLWNLLPEVEEKVEEIKTSFEFITEEELK